MTNLVAEELERVVEARVPWAAILVCLGIVYLVGHFVVWAVRGFPV